MAARYRAGGEQRLLGGDFYDVVKPPDGWVHALIGDVCGRGPGEAALGVCLRVAWRALVLAGHPADEVLSAVQQVLEHEQQEEAMFATVCMLSVAPDRSSGMLRLAGHPAPLLVTPDGVTELTAPVSPPVGLNAARRWPGHEVSLGDNWSLLMYTDGLIEGRISQGPYRLGTDGLIDLVRDALGPLPYDPGAGQRGTAAAAADGTGAQAQQRRTERRHRDPRARLLMTTPPRLPLTVPLAAGRSAGSSAPPCWSSRCSRWRRWSPAGSPWRG